MGKCQGPVFRPRGACPANRPTVVPRQKSLATAILAPSRPQRPVAPHPTWHRRAVEDAIRHAALKGQINTGSGCHCRPHGAAISVGADQALWSNFVPGSQPPRTLRQVAKPCVWSAGSSKAPHRMFDDVLVSDLRMSAALDTRLCCGNKYLTSRRGAAFERPTTLVSGRCQNIMIPQHRPIVSR
jgi:hypothetical protein